PAAAGEGTVREQIAREVKARLELAERTRQVEAEAKAAKKKHESKAAKAGDNDATNEAEAAAKLQNDAFASAPADEPDTTGASESIAQQVANESTDKSEGATS
ncbi:MAG: hypothetical protein SFX73_20460, partial [Kofleriaceae bacterium]|nr:hypothetical protein [Kofleriaceae bacterium]